MSSRDRPYLYHPTTNVVQLISIASRISLYLVNQSDVMDFTFKDRLGKVNSVHIGATIRCTCQQKLEHCLHSIYVLLRIFKLPNDNPLLWQNSYLQSEVIDIITGRYSIQKVNQMVASIVEDKVKQIEIDKKFKVQRLQINEQSVCSICQQPMKTEMSLSHCQSGCGNNFHTNCLKIWIDHKQSTEGKVTCPMCRCQYSKEALENIRKEEQNHLRKQHKIQISKQKFSCQQCGKKPITSKVYKCLFCEMFCLCEQCFVSNKHSKHPFIKFVRGEWEPAPREQPNKKEQSESSEDYTDVLDYIVNVYPYVSRYLSQNMDPNRKLKFSVEECKCFCCGNDKIIFLRRLPCGHYIDDICAKDLINKNKMYCYIDGSKFLKGYENLLKIQDEVEKKIQSTLKEQTKEIETFLDKDISDDYSSDYSEYDIPVSLNDIIEIAVEPIIPPKKFQPPSNVIKNVQHLPPINKKPQSVIKPPIKQTLPVRSSSILYQQKRSKNQTFVRNSSIKSRVAQNANNFLKSLSNNSSRRI